MMARQSEREREKDGLLKPSELVERLALDYSLRHVPNEKISPALAHACAHDTEPLSYS